jgi:hypothetical protein
VLFEQGKVNELTYNIFAQSSTRYAIFGPAHWSGPEARLSATHPVVILVSPHCLTHVKSASSRDIRHQGITVIMELLGIGMPLKLQGEKEGS